MYTCKHDFPQIYGLYFRIIFLLLQCHEALIGAHIDEHFVGSTLIDGYRSNSAYIICTFYLVCCTDLDMRSYVVVHNSHIA